jgi:hypothetical protein
VETGAGETGAVGTGGVETGGVAPQADDRLAEDGGDADAVRCRACTHVAAHRSDAIAVADAHERTFRNPAGWSFRVACYRRAPGCAPSGEPTTDHTWYDGFAWQLLHCGRCGGHLGWWFTATGTDAATGTATGTTDGGGFAGLIATRIR